MANDEKQTATKLVNGGRRPDWRGRLVNPPVERASTILFDSVAQLRSARPRLGSHVYGLQGTATQWALAEALTELEPGAAGTALTETGLAAVTAAITAVLSAGDELLMVDSVYGPTRRFCDVILPRFGIGTRYYDPVATADQLEAMIGERTRALFLESPGSHTFEVQDVPGLCAMAKRRGLASILDNTWATPLFFPAMANGVDISIQALSKYVGGHSDLLLGSVTANAEWYERVQQTVFDFGHSASPDDSWLTSRGLRTLGVRLKQHEENALAVARWLADHPKVARVLHPAFDSCPGHEHWKRDFRGSSGLFSFVLRGGSAGERDKLIEKLELFGIGYSWGGFESLAIPAEPVRTATTPEWEGPLVRLHIGLEDYVDLIADLEQVLAGYPKR